MSNAHYFRTQAELYLALSQRMSLHGDAEYFRVLAGRHLAAALELERERAMSLPSRQASEG